MFSRNELKHHSKRYEDYYLKCPKLKITDEKIRKNPGLLSGSAKLYESLSFTAAEASNKISKSMGEKYWS